MVCALLHRLAPRLSSALLGTTPFVTSPVTVSRKKGKETIVCSLYRYIQDYLIEKIFARKKLCWNLKSVWVAEPEG